MKRTILIRVVAAVVLIVFSVGTWIKSGQLNVGWLQFFSACVFIATMIISLWDIWLWRIPLVQRIPGVPRSVRGTWQGTLSSFWVDPGTNRRISPKPAYLVVRQSYSLVSVTLLTDESKSTSSLASVSMQDHTAVLAYLYVNRPRPSVEDHSRMHHGSTVLDIVGTPAIRLEGRYWTDRESRGELLFSARVKSMADDYAQAGSLF
jgi:hypothetical protein